MTVPGHSCAPTNPGSAGEPPQNRENDSPAQPFSRARRRRASGLRDVGRWPRARELQSDWSTKSSHAVVASVEGGTLLDSRSRSTPVFTQRLRRDGIGRPSRTRRTRGSVARTFTSPHCHDSRRNHAGRLGCGVKRTRPPSLHSSMGSRRPRCAPSSVSGVGRASSLRRDRTTNSR